MGTYIFLSDLLLSISIDLLFSLVDMTCLVSRLAFLEDSVLFILPIYNFMSIILLCILSFASFLCFWILKERDFTAFSFFSNYRF